MKTESQQKKVEKYVTDDLVSRRTQTRIHTSKQSFQQEQDGTNLFIKHIHLVHTAVHKQQTTEGCTTKEVKHSQAFFGLSPSWR